MNGLGTFNGALTFAELLPTLSTWLSGAAITSITSAAAFSGTILFPFLQAINLINANETGLRPYSYRAISYTITAWAFDKVNPMSSPSWNFSHFSRGCSQQALESSDSAGLVYCFAVE